MKLPDDKSLCNAGCSGDEMPLSLFHALCERPDACLALLASPPERRAEWCREAVAMTKREAGALAAAITKTVPELR